MTHTKALSPHDGIEPAYSIPSDVSANVRATRIDNLMSQFRSDWLRSKQFGLKFTDRLPPMAYDDAHAARENAYGVYWNSSSLSAGNRDLYQAQVSAIDTAEQAAWRAKGKRRGGSYSRPGGSQLARIREALLIRDGDDCWLCGKAMPFEDCTLEHLTPLSLGGENEPSNYALAHGACNVALGDRPLKAKIEMRRVVRKGRAA